MMNVCTYIEWIGHFLLTELVLERMVETAKSSGVEGRIVNVSSCLHTWSSSSGIPFHKLMSNDQHSRCVCVLTCFSLHTFVTKKFFKTLFVSPFFLCYLLFSSNLFVFNFSFNFSLSFPSISSFTASFQDFPFY